MFVGAEKILEYNEKGFLTKFYINNHNRQSAPLVKSDLFFYDETDTIPMKNITLNATGDTLRAIQYEWKSENELWTTDLGGHDYQRHIYKNHFDSLGRVDYREIEHINSGNIRSHTYTYHPNGLLKSELYQSSEAYQNEIITYRYDSLRRVVTERKKEGDFLVFERIYSYEGQTIKMESQSYRNNRTTKRGWIKQLDEHGNETSYTYFGISGKDPEVTYRYWYDNHGNWTKRYMYVAGIIRSVDYQWFTYY